MDFKGSSNRGTTHGICYFYTQYSKLIQPFRNTNKSLIVCLCASQVFSIWMGNYLLSIAQWPQIRFSLHFFMPLLSFNIHVTNFLFFPITSHRVGINTKIIWIL